MKTIKKILKEKNISEERDLAIPGQIGLTVGVVNEFINRMESDTKKAMLDKLVMIDFNNGNILKFYEYLAVGMVELFKEGGGVGELEKLIKITKTKQEIKKEITKI